MRDRYDITCPEIDELVAISVDVPGVIGSRMTGGGFGGCTVSLVRPDAVEALRERVERDYPARTGQDAAPVDAAGHGRGRLRRGLSRPAGDRPASRSAQTAVTGLWRVQPLVDPSVRPLMNCFWSAKKTMSVGMATSTAPAASRL